jgi:hypothetical protein
MILPVPKKTISEIQIKDQDALQKENHPPLMGGAFVLSDTDSPQITKHYQDSYQGPTEPEEDIIIPVTAKKAFLDSKDKSLFLNLNQYAKGRFLVIPNVVLSRLVDTTEKSVSVHLLKRLRNHGVQYVLIDRHSLKIRLAISVKSKVNSDSLIFVKDVLKAAEIPYLTLDRDEACSMEEIESLLDGKLLPESARLSTQKTG